MKLEKKLKNYILKLFSEESEALSNREWQLEENVQNLYKIVAGYEAVAENVRNLNVAMEVQEAVAENVRNLNKIVAGYEVVAENVRNLNAAMEVQEAVAENVRNLNKIVAGYEVVAENVRNLNSMLQEYEKLIENLRNNNTSIDILNSQMEMQKVKLIMLEKEKNAQYCYRDTSKADDLEAKHDISMMTENVYSGIDYFDFENHFRGSIQRIRETQECYVKYFIGCENVIDLGCGRGEFLELLNENGVDAHGVDLYEEFVEMCRLKKLRATQADAIEFLRNQQKVGGIFAAQLVEHISTQQLVTLCEVAYDKLVDGAYMVLETPNPQSLSIFTNSFYIDPSHDKPIHPLTMQYILQKVGFREIEIIYTATSKPQITIPPIEQENMEEFNDAMQKVEHMLFGSQDYAIVAKK